MIISLHLSLLTSCFSFTAQLPAEPSNGIQCLWYYTKRRDKECPFVILHNKEIHLELPNFLRILFHLLEHIAKMQEGRVTNKHMSVYVVMLDNDHTEHMV